MNRTTRSRRIPGCERRLRRHGPWPVLLLLTLTAAGTRAAETGLDVGVDVAVATDYIYRGISQTMSSPALQACLEASLENGFYAYLWASNVDFVPAGDPDDGARVELDFALGYDFRLSERVSATVAWMAYRYPGTSAGVDYDYSELTGSLQLDERHAVSIGYAANAFGSGGRGLYYSASTGAALSSRVQWKASVGRFDLRDAVGTAYAHASVSLYGDISGVGWDLSYHRTSNAAASQFYESTVEPRLVLTLTRSL